MHPIYGDEPLYDVPLVRTYQDLLRHGARAWPDKLALADLTPTPVPQVTFSALLHLAVRFGRALKQQGLAPRAHVAVLGENRVQWAVAYLGITANNFVAVPIDAKLRENEIAAILHASDAVAAVFSESFRQTVLDLDAAASGEHVLIDMDLPAHRDGLLSMRALLEDPATAGPDAFDAPVDPEALSALLFTSGSMGTAKGVMLSQRNICANLTAMLQMMEIRPDDRFLSVLPMHHSYEATCGMLCPLMAGASVHYARSLRTISEDMLAVRPTVLLAVPLLYEKMYRRIAQGIAEKRFAPMLVGTLKAVAALAEMIGMDDMRSRLFRGIHEKFGGAVRLFIAGGAAPSVPVARGLRALGFTFRQGYGLTETSPILTLNRMRRFRDQAAGLPLPGIELRIDAPDPHGSGEILARGASVMMGYYRNEEATRAAFTPDGFFRTGDVGFIDDEGFLHINGRKKNVIIARNGENVFPEELEEEIVALPFVLECVVRGERTPDGDEIIAALVVPDASAVYEHAAAQGVEVGTALVQRLMEEGIRALNARWPGHKQIRRVEVRDTEFEKTTTQKIKRHRIDGAGS